MSRVEAYEVEVECKMLVQSKKKLHLFNSLLIVIILHMILDIVIAVIVINNWWKFR